MSYKTHSTYRGPVPDRMTSLEVQRAVVAQVRADCDRGQHRVTETDDVTGDEVCRLCGTVVE